MFYFYLFVIKGAVSGYLVFFLLLSFFLVRRESMFSKSESRILGKVSKFRLVLEFDST